MDNKNTFYVVVGIVAIGLILYSLFAYTPKEEGEVISILSFEDCALAGYPIMESYPRQCKTPEGLTFAEELPLETDVITYTNSSTDLITVLSPTPGSVTGKVFTLMGEARGNWYFEASFPVTVLDADGAVLVETYATAQGEWMTTEFVPYMSEITIPEDYIGPATLVLKKDNASGLPEHDASISFPFVIEY